MCFFLGCVSTSCAPEWNGDSCKEGWRRGNEEDGGRNSDGRLTKRTNARPGTDFSPSSALMPASTWTPTSEVNCAPVFDAPASLEQRPASSERISYDST